MGFYVDMPFSALFLFYSMITMNVRKVGVQGLHAI